MKMASNRDGETYVNPNISEPADVGIIGCGVAGLTAALSCAYHGMTVDIFERAKTVESAIGGGLGLNGGLVGLTKMGYHSVFKDILQPVS